MTMFIPSLGKHLPDALPDCEATSNLPVLRQWPRLLCQLLEESPRVVKVWTDPYIRVEKMIQASLTLSKNRFQLHVLIQLVLVGASEFQIATDSDGAKLVGFDGTNSFSRDSWTVPSCVSYFACPAGGTSPPLCKMHYMRCR